MFDHLRDMRDYFPRNSFVQIVSIAIFAILVYKILALYIAYKTYEAELQFRLAVQEIKITQVRETCRKAARSEWKVGFGIFEGAYMNIEAYKNCIRAEEIINRLESDKDRIKYID